MLIVIMSNGLPPDWNEEAYVRPIFNRDGSPNADYKSITEWGDGQINLADKLVHNPEVENGLSWVMHNLAMIKPLRSKN